MSRVRIQHKHHMSGEWLTLPLSDIEHGADDIIVGRPFRIMVDKLEVFNSLVHCSEETAK